MEASPQLVVGTAGHIDHGKSRLVLALTGTDPDRLPEEKARGMTIDLGFAHTRVEGCDVWFVDVPGHERFIRNMVAGATGIDVALLVVAADDSVMPQTREHAELLNLLGVERCVVVLSKMDLVDDEWAEQVEEEVRALLESLAIRPVCCVRTSVETGRGLDELRAVLASLARAGTPQRAPYRWFRLPVDRAFVIAGRGTVVTGSLAHGCVARDDELELWPAGRRARVRDLQSHNEQRDAAAGRMRLAVNLAGVSVDQVRRGCELATPGYLQPTRCLEVWLTSLRMPGKIRRRIMRLRLHIATSEVLAELRLPAEPADDALGGDFAQLRLAEPVVATWGQRFVLRDESGSRTLGGGRVLRPLARRWTGKHPVAIEGLRRLLDGSPEQRLEEVIRANEWQDCDPGRLASRAGLENAQAAAALLEQLVSRRRVCRLEAGAARAHVHASHLAGLAELLAQRLKRYFHENPRVAGVPRNQWPGWMPRVCPPRLRAMVAEWLLASGYAALADGFVVPIGHSSAISPPDQALLDAILKEYYEGAFQPPSPETLKCRTARNERRVRELVELAAARGTLARIADGLWLHRQRWVELTELVARSIRERGDLSVAEIRTLLNSSRKYVVPIVEHLDASGVTRRVGDLRTLGPKAPGG